MVRGRLEPARILAKYKELIFRIQFFKSATHINNKEYAPNTNFGFQIKKYIELFSSKQDHVICTVEFMCCPAAPLEGRDQVS